MIDLKSGEPYINVWFGNFYRPAYDDKAFIEESLVFLKGLGFNSILLDSKAWEDFRDRFDGLAASPYVEMQEFMQTKIQELGLSHDFLALYLNGDNLYPNIRFSPPVYGESVVNADGEDGKWYRYWSDKAKDSMVEHVAGLLKAYSTNHTAIQVNGEERLPLCSMWDPIVAPSFDEEGRNRYLQWLKDQYKHDIACFNKAYHTSFSGFEELCKEDYWFECAYPGKRAYSLESLKTLSPECILWADNMKWKIQELCLYFKDMQERFRRLDPRLYLCPDMAQWNYFLNVDGALLSEMGFSELWDTSMRGIDVYKLAEYVDSCHFITVPVTPYGDADAYVVSCQHSMMRAMNTGRKFVGGVYWGRFLYNDVYQMLTPCEIVGSLVASGASGYSSYGMCGLDDGGVLHRMDASFLSSLTVANQWAKQVIPQLGKIRQKKVALLFPSAMAAFESIRVSGNKERRMDLLGWYKLCSDGGYSPDVIDLSGVIRGELQNYCVLILPANDAYPLDINEEAEDILRKWVQKGGILLHGPEDSLAQRVTGICGRAHVEDVFFGEEGGIPQGDCYAAFEGEEILAAYKGDSAGCIVRNTLGQGQVYSFGFYFGYSYTAKIIPHVPHAQKNNEMYPVPLMRWNVVWNILNKHLTPCPIRGKNIETAEFEHGLIVINHTSVPLELGDVKGQPDFQYPVKDTLLLPRSAVFMQY